MTRWSRVVRGTLAAIVSTFVAAFSHAIAGGALPGAAGLSLTFVFSWLVCIALAGRRWPLARLAVSIAASQAMFHSVFSSLGSSAASAAPTGLMAVHDHNAPLVFTGLPGHAHDPAEMWLAHLAAALITFAVLAFGERTITSIAQRAALAVVRFARRMPEPIVDSPLVGVVAARLRAVTPRVRRLPFTRLRHRGPPVFCFA